MPSKASLAFFAVLALAAVGCAGPDAEEAWRHAPSFDDPLFHRTSRLWSIRLEADKAPGGVSLKPDTRPRPLKGAVAQAPGKGLVQSRQRSREEWLAAFLASASPAAFIELQREVDMAWLLEGLDEWDAVRLGARGPLRAGRDVLNRKRAAVIVDFSQRWTPGRAEAFTLFILDTAFKNDVQDVLRRLSSDKRLGATLLRMPDIRKALERRGIRLADYADRPERLSDGLRGLGQGLEYLLDSSPLSNGAAFTYYQGCKRQMPAAYQRLLDHVEAAEIQAWLSQKHVLLGGFDTLTFGVPLGLYGLVAGTGQGLYHLAQGQYESAGQELTGATLVVLAYAEARAFDSTPAAAPVAERAPAFDSVARDAERPRPGVAQLWEAQLWERVQRGEPPGSPLGQLGEDELRQLASYLKDDPDAALFVYDKGEAGALALSRARGNVARAQALLPEVEQPRAMAAGDSRGGTLSTQPGARGAVNRPLPPPSGAREPPGRRGMPAQEVPPEELLALGEAPSPEEVLRQKVDEFERGEPGERMTGDLVALEKLRPALDKPPPGVPENDPMWSRYVEYWGKRFREMRAAAQAPVPPEEPPPPPRTLVSYRRFFDEIARGRAAEERLAMQVMREADLPAGQRTYTGDIEEPLFARHVGVSKGKGVTTRYPDLTALDRKPTPGQPRVVKTFSFKSRRLKDMPPKVWEAVMEKDAKYAHDYYGGELEFRRRSLRMQGQKVQISKVYLIYDIDFMPDNTKALQTIIARIRTKFGVEVLFR